MSAPNPNLKFILGIFIMFCGWIICFDLFLLIIGIPFFLVGMLLVLLSKKSMWTKIITITLPIVLWYAVFEFILHSINQKTPITMLIPENYNGEVRVVYGELNGVVPEEEEGRMILEIPRNGVLVIQPHLQSGLEDIQYYYVDAKKQRTKLDAIKMRGQTGVKYPAVYFEGTQSPPSPAGQSSNVPAKLDYVYDSFDVVLDQLANFKPLSDTIALNQKMKYDWRTDSLVKVCRGIK